MNLVITRRTRLFCKAYIIDYNVVNAGLKAGYKNRRSASVQGCRALKRPEVKYYIKLLESERTKRLQIDSDRVLKEFAKLAFVDVNNFYDSNGKLKALKDISPEDRAAIAGITYDNNFNPVVKVHDKLKALDNVARHLGLYEVSAPKEPTSNLTTDEISKAVADGLPD